MERALVLTKNISKELNFDIFTVIMPMGCSCLFQSYLGKLQDIVEDKVNQFIEKCSL